MEGAGAVGLAAVLGDYVPELKGKKYTNLLLTISFTRSLLALLSESYSFKAEFRRLESFPQRLPPEKNRLAEVPPRSVAIFLKRKFENWQQPVLLTLTDPQGFSLGGNVRGMHMSFKCRLV